MNGNQVGRGTTEATDKIKEKTGSGAGKKPADGSEATQKGGKESAKRQAERDWENSSKESGE